MHYHKLLLSFTMPTPIQGVEGAVTDRPTGKIVPLWGLTVMRPGVMAIKAGEM